MEGSSTGLSYSIPSNTDISKRLDEAEEILEETKKEQKYNLTRDGQKIIDTTEKLIEDTKTFVNERNRNDTLQQIVFEGQQFYKDLQTNRSKWGDLYKSIQSYEGKFDTTVLLKKMDTVSRISKLVSVELISSATFRQTIYDFFSVLYTVIIDSSQITKVGKPLREAFEKTESTTEKLKEAGEEAVRIGLDYMDPDKQAFVLSDDQKREMWKKFQVILNELSRRERPQRMIHGIFDILEMLFKPFLDLSSKVSSTSEKLMNDEHIQNIMALSQQFFESLTRTSLDPLVSHFKVLYYAVLEDEKLRFQVVELRNWILNVLDNPETLGLDATYEKFSEITSNLKTLIAAKADLKFTLTIMKEEIEKLIYSLEQDPLTISIQNDIKTLVKMILLDDKGRITFKPEILDQLKLIILSAVVKRLRVPLPELTADDPNSSFAFKLNGLILGIQDILPERIIAENHGIAILNVKDKSIEKSWGKRADYFEPAVAKAAEAVKIRMENINVHMPEADVWFHKRSFPEIQDSGKATIDIGGNGLDLEFILKTELGSDRLFSLTKVECTVHSLSLKLADTKHDYIYNMLISLFSGSVKRNIEEAIQESMIGVFEQLNDSVEKQMTYLRSTMPILGSSH